MDNFNLQEISYLGQEEDSHISKVDISHDTKEEDNDNHDIMMMTVHIDCSSYIEYI
jgi:hypothetical protein